MAELLLGQPLFPGDSGVDQLVEIIKVLGTPAKEQIQAMNPNYTDFRFPQIKGHSWNKVFRNKTPPEAIDLISKLLHYTPSQRYKPMEGCVHPFFDELRDPITMLPNSRQLPSLFNFTPSELAAARRIPKEQLIPQHAISQLPASIASTLSSSLSTPSTSSTTSSDIPPAESSNNNIKQSNTDSLNKNEITTSVEGLNSDITSTTSTTETTPSNINITVSTSTTSDGTTTIPK